MAQASNHGRISLRMMRGSMAVALVLAGCSGGDPSSPGVSHPTNNAKPKTPANTADAGGVDDPDPGNGDSGAYIDPNATMTTGDETWADGKQLSASVVIAAGATVTIGAGATITAAS